MVVAEGPAPQHASHGSVSLEGPGFATALVQNLVKVPVSDGSPNTQASVCSVIVRLNALKTNATQFLDHMGYTTELREWMEWLGNIEGVLEKGKYFVHMLYSFRSSSRAIPMSKDASRGQTGDLYRETFKILQPEIAKIKELLEFSNELRLLFSTSIQRLITCDWRTANIPESFYIGVLKMLDLLQRLDNLKDMKASLNNDFSRFKRAFNAIRSDISDSEILAEEMHEINLFLASPTHPKNLMFHNLRTELKKLAGSEQVLVHLLNLCVDYLNEQKFVLPEEKYGFIRVLPHLLWLIDSDYSMKRGGDTPRDASASTGQTEPINVFKHRAVRLNAIQEVFKRYPVVPEFGDLVMTMGFVLDKCPHYDDASMSRPFGRQPDDKIKGLYNVRTHWRRIRNQYGDYLASFTSLSSRIHAQPFVKDRAHMESLPKIFDIVLQGLRLLEQWTSCILEMIAWKFSHPCSTEVLDKASSSKDTPGKEYETVGRYNYSKEELSALIDVMSMTKSLAGAMIKSEPLLAPYLRFYMHERLQKLAQEDLVPVLHRVHKNRRSMLNLLLEARRVVADWKQGKEPVDDYKRYRRTHGKVRYDIPSRLATASTTQLEIFRIFVKGLMDSGAGQSGGCFGGKGDVRPEEMEILQNFHSSSFYFPYMLDYGSSIRAMVDFSDLWYREFFLEITRQVQFPIHMSLPWIITEHLLANQSVEAPMLENLLYALDIYNDAAQRSLYSIDRQFMYDEIEAELNLAFDQFSFLVADEIYGYFKNMASGLVMDTEYKKKINSFGDSNAFQQAIRRFKIPLEQRHIKLLGRAVDLNYIVSQHVNEKLSQDFETSIRRFESQDPTSFVDFDVTLNVLRSTHSLLSDHLSLIPFEFLLLEVNEGGETASHKTRIAMHILDDLVNDLIPNFSYNVRTQRFYRSPVCNRKTSYNSAPKAASSTLYGDLCYKAYEAQGRLYRGFVGKEHLQHMVHLLGSSLPHIVKELVNFLEERLLLIKIYTAALQPGIPPCKLPKFVFQLGGCYTYFKEYLKPLLNHEDLKPVVFQTFREFGNTVALLQDLSDLIDIQEITRMIQLAPFTSAQREGKKVESPLARCLAALQLDLKNAPGMMKVSKVSEDLSKAASRSNGLYENLSSCKSLIQLVLKKVDDFMVKQEMKKEWLGSTAENGIIDMESTKEFYRFWSAISFIFSCEDNSAKESNGPPDELEYAHGFVLGGIFLVLILGQRERFEMLDFSRHLVSVHEYEVATAFSGKAKVGMVDNSTIEEARSFIDRALKKQNLERDIFEMCSEVFKPCTTEGLTFRPPRS